MLDENREALQGDGSYGGVNRIIYYRQKLVQANPQASERAEAILRRFAQSLPDAEPYKLVQLLYDMIAQNVTYDHAALEQDPPEETTFLWYKPLLIQTGVCEGIAQLFLARLRRIKGCAVHLLVRRCSGLNDTVQRQLQTRTWPAESLPCQLLTEGALFEAVVCISGDPSGLLAAEVCTAFGGALTTENAKAPIDGRIFETAPCPSGVVPLYKPLCYAYLPYEAAALTSLTASAGQYGLPVNNDTLPGLLPVTTKGELLLGQDCKGSPVWMPLRNLPLGTAILGTPGSGKGNLLVTLAMQLAKKKIPTLIIENPDSEYALPLLHARHPVLPAHSGPSTALE